MDGLEEALSPKVTTEVFSFDFPRLRRPLRLLCLGAHSDDLEIGCGGTILHWLATRGPVAVTWVVFGAADSRAAEARQSARALLRRAFSVRLHLHEFRDGYFPAQFSDLKEATEQLKSSSPDVILTHRLEDRHQDHRAIAELTWQTFRDHLVLEYEIPKYDGDLGLPNFYVPLPGQTARRKIEHLIRHFSSQRGRDWFKRETFAGLLQTRAVECRAASGFAEAFYLRKAVHLQTTKGR